MVSVIHYLNYILLVLFSVFFCFCFQSIGTSLLVSFNFHNPAFTACNFFPSFSSSNLSFFSRHLSYSFYAISVSSIFVRMGRTFLFVIRKSTKMICFCGLPQFLSPLTMAVIALLFLYYYYFTPYLSLYLSKLLSLVTPNGICIAK